MDLEWFSGLDAREPLLAYELPTQPAGLHSPSVLVFPGGRSEHRRKYDSAASAAGRFRLALSRHAMIHKKQTSIQTDKGRGGYLADQSVIDNQYTHDIA